MSGGCDRGGAGARGIGGLAPAAPAPAAAPAPPTNPLRLSGLVLAGANRRDHKAPGQEDGILTAEEIATLDLAGVEWAVLSACDTGVGEVDLHEGVLGLRRAFLLAGARTVVTSLWSVQDEAARAWMEAFYRARLERGLDTAEAVRAASLALLHRGGRDADPSAWAAFIAVGDWR